MELTAAARVLARHWRVVLAGAVISIAAGLSAGGLLPLGPKIVGEKRSGVAESKALVDTRSSYVGDLEGGTEALGTQAALLASLIADEPQRREVARRAGVAPAALDVLVGSITDLKVPSTLARRLTEVVERPRLPYAVTVRTDTSLSVVTIEAAAPTRGAAARLARAATETLAATAAAVAPDRGRALLAEPLGRVRSLQLVESSGSTALIAVMLAIAVFSLWCSAVVVRAGLARFWRAGGP